MKKGKIDIGALPKVLIGKLKHKAHANAREIAELIAELERLDPGADKADYVMVPRATYDRIMEVATDARDFVSGFASYANAARKFFDR